MVKFQKNSTILLLVLFSISLNVNSQSNSPELPIDLTTNKIMYTDVVHTDSTLLKADLFTLARIWFAETFRTSGAVIQMEDKESGVLIGKAIVPIIYKSFGVTHDLQNVLFTLSIYFKDGRYKYEMTDFIYQQQSPSPLIEFNDIPFEYIYFNKNLGVRKYNKKTRLSFVNQLDTQVKIILKDLISSMDKKNTPVDSEW
ncbi:DUF4468 domain-containing protein [Draconibacterium halophilum]|uniref:DUF4468 domain-containing protein n=1 Tax=Draconibacterium halophilum TaxID=2706887 RepID=A0A6C0R926_9BACT|nr:DUF4468 domain-containing protein [Draconibacterium halophilum]QIA06840.1 DUF4468 domain-containing protein [Draconibacterium halophilum]